MTSDPNLLDGANHHRTTRDAYNDGAEDWVSRKTPQSFTHLDRFMEALDDDAAVVDLGCGPGWHLPSLGDATVGLDASRAMLDIAQSTVCPDANPPQAAARLIQADLGQLPFRRAAFDGAWASRSLVHLARSEVPLALAELHRALAPGARFGGVVFAGGNELRTWADDRLPGRAFSSWAEPHLRSVLQGAGFAVDHLAIADDDRIEFLAHRLVTLPDTVGSAMTMLVCGLNPSPSSATAGVGFFRAGNRFWPAALAAGIVSVDRDPLHALRQHGVGMTDLVKRVTRRADEITSEEYTEGLERVEQIVRWLKPGAVCMVGLAGWRTVRDKTAQRGWQPELFGDKPLYLMPSTSGLNAHDTVDSLTKHLLAASAE